MSLKTLSYHIKQATRYNLFLGAGASIESEGYSAQTIAFGILRQLYGAKPDSELEALFWSDFKRPVSFENVLETIGIGKPDQREMLANFFTHMVPSEGYRYLAALMKANYFYPIILTTNFDHMLEESLKADDLVDRKIKITTLVQEEVVSSDIEPQPDEIIIVKLHGDISKPESLKLSISETASLTKPCEDLVIRLFEQQGLIIVGYRGKDIGIRNALERAKPSAKGLFWISKSLPDELTDIEVYLLINRHNSKNNIISETFDSVFKLLGMPLIKVEIRRKYVRELDEAWTLLDKARSYGSERPHILEHLEKLVTELHTKLTLEEVLALEEFLRYEFDRSGETYRLQQGVQFLENTLNEYSEYMEGIELAQLEYALLRELLNLFLSGNQIPGGRLAHLLRLISRGEAFLQKIPRKQRFLKAKCLIVLGEAIKEQSMITEETDTYVQLYTQARNYLEEAIKLTEDVDTVESRHLLGMAYRHMAVTFEEEGDQCSEEAIRKEKYEKWRHYSSSAIEILKEVGEETSRSYALMNLASSYTRLCDFEVSDWKKRQLLDEGKKDLLEAIQLLRKVYEHRGIGWAYIHLCENTRSFFNLTVESKQRSSLLTEMESYANRAVAEIKQIEDHLALGLAYEQLGITLYLVFLGTRGNALIKLERAVRALQEGINQLLKTGFYRGTGEAYSWLAKCQFALWEKTSNVDFLQSAVHSLIEGTISTAIGLKTPQTLEPLYTILDDQIRKLL